MLDYHGVFKKIDSIFVYEVDTCRSIYDKPKSLDENEKYAKCINNAILKRDDMIVITSKINLMAKAIAADDS